DPLRDLHSGDENDSGAMSAVMQAMRAIRDIVGCSVVFLHHSKKGASAGRGGQDMRGSTAIHGAYDFGFHFSGLDSDGQSYWSSDIEVEVRDARGAGKFSLRLDLEDDAHGEAIRATWTVDRDKPRSKGSGID